jgi:TonB family protein
MVDVVVLSDDVALFQATRDAIGERNPVWRARTAAESVELLLTGRCGVLMVDVSAVSSQPASLVAQIVDQFPDVVVVVAGRREDEPLLAELVSEGHVYRFMHKPLSPKRAGMFLQAAIRAHLERRDGRDRAPRLPGVGALRPRFEPRKWLFVGGGLALFVAALAAVLVARHEDGEVRKPAQATTRPAAAPANVPRADPVLSSARAALAAGRYESPPGRNALDLYAAVLLARPGNAEARDGLAATAGILVERAEAAMASGDATEARRIAQRVLSVSAGHEQARELLARLEAPPAPAAVPAQQTALQAPAATSRPAPEAAPARAAARADTKSRGTAQPVSARGPDRQAAQRAAATPRPVSPRPRTAVPRTVRVTPDPLTPRIITAPSPARRAQPAGRSRSYGAPISSGHAVAGVAASDLEPSPALSTATSIESADSGSAPAVPARDLEAVATPEPVYPPEAFRNRVEGWAEVEFTVNERGATGDIVVVAAEPRGVFDAAATDAVAAWRYLPRVVNGQPVPQRTSVTLRFNVED